MVFEKKQGLYVADMRRAVSRLQMEIMGFVNMTYNVQVGVRGYLCCFIFPAIKQMEQRHI
jgi:hypothetical protein